MQITQNTTFGIYQLIEFVLLEKLCLLSILYTKTICTSSILQISSTLAAQYLASQVV
jgi:hypothetical protein